MIFLAVMFFSSFCTKQQSAARQWGFISDAGFYYRAYFEKSFRQNRIAAGGTLR
jgi:hypothetical protein